MARSSHMLEADETDAVRQLEELARSPLGRSSTSHQTHAGDALLTHHGLAPSSGAQAFDAISRSIQSIIDHMDVADSRNADALRRIQGELKALRASAPGGAAGGSHIPDGFNAIEQRLEDLARKIESVDHKAAEPGMKALEQRVSSFANTLGGVAKSTNPQVASSLLADPGLAALTGYRPVTQPAPPAQQEAKPGDRAIGAILAGLDSDTDEDEHSDSALELGFLRRRGIDLAAEAAARKREDDRRKAAEAERQAAEQRREALRLQAQREEERRRAAIRQPGIDFKVPQPLPTTATRATQPAPMAFAGSPSAHSAATTEQMLERHAARLGEQISTRFEQLAESLKAQIATPAPSRELGELQDSVHQLALKLDELAARPVAARDEEMAQQVDAISERLDAAEARFSGIGDLTGSIEKLTARIAAAEQGLLDMAKSRFETKQSMEDRFAALEQQIIDSRSNILDEARDAAIDAAGNAVREATVSAQDAALDAAREAARAMLRREAGTVSASQADAAPQMGDTQELVNRLHSNLAGIGEQIRHDDEDDAGELAEAHEVEFEDDGEDENIIPEPASGIEDDEDEGSEFAVPGSIADIRLPPLAEAADMAAPASDEDLLLLEEEVDEAGDQTESELAVEAELMRSSPASGASHAMRMPGGSMAQQATPSLRDARSTNELLAAARRAAHAASVQQSIMEARKPKRQKLSHTLRLKGWRKPRVDRPSAAEGALAGNRVSSIAHENEPAPIPASSAAVQSSRKDMLGSATAALAGTQGQPSAIRVGPRVTPQVSKPKVRKGVLLATVALLAIAGAASAYVALGRPDLPQMLRLLDSAKRLVTSSMMQTDLPAAQADVPTDVQPTAANTFALASVPATSIDQTSDPEPTAAITVVKAVDAPAVSTPSSDAEPPLAAAPLPAEIGPAALRDAATAGDSIAQFEVANRYMDGRGVAADTTAAAAWYQRAAAQGLAVAQYRLASLYERGDGVASNPNLAKLWYERAATSGNRRAMHNLGVIYANTNDPDSDYTKAAFWFKQAAEFGLGDSQYNLAILYTRGLGVPADQTEAYKWFSILANNGDGDAAARRDQIAAQLDSKTLTAAKLAAQTWRAKEIIAEANAVRLPADGWETATPAQNEVAENTAALPLPGADVIGAAQSLLNRLGYSVGTPDGVWGPRTKAAIESFQRETGVAVDGQLTPTLVKSLQQVLAGNSA